MIHGYFYTKDDRPGENLWHNKLRTNLGYLYHDQKGNVMVELKKGCQGSKLFGLEMTSQVVPTGSYHSALIEQAVVAVTNSALQLTEFRFRSGFLRFPSPPHAAVQIPHTLEGRPTFRI